MSWNLEAIRAHRASTFDERFKDATFDDLKQHILDLETAMYPFANTLRSLNEKSWRGTYVTSGLFPTITKGQAYAYTVDGVNQTPEHAKITFADIPEDKWHLYCLDLRESVDITDGRTLDDSFVVLDVHQQAPCAYVHCGDISMGDIRHLVSFIFPNHGKRDD